MSLFDKIGKAVTSAAETVGNATVQGTEALGEGVIHTANAATDVSHQAVNLAGQGAEDLGNLTIQGATALGNTLIGAFNSLSNQVNTGLDQARNRINSIIQSPERLVLDSKVTQFAQNSGNIIALMAVAAKKVAQRMGEDVLIELRSAAQNKRLDASVINNLSTIMQDPDIQNAIAALQNTFLFTFTIAFGGSAAAVAGVSGQIGFAVPFPDVQDSRLFGSVGGSLGTQAGGDVKVTVGLFLQKPADMAGPGIGFDAEGSFEEGVGAAVSFDLLNIDIAGIQFCEEEGLGAEAALTAGYTWVLG